MAEENTTTEPTPDSPSSKAKGSRGKRIAIWILVVVVVAAAAWGAWWVYDRAQVEQGAQAKVEEATTLIEDADVTVLEVDEVVRAEVTEEIGEQAAVLRDEVPATLEDLEAAVEMIEDAIPELPAEDVAHARALASSAEARAEMLAPVDIILEANIKAAAALGPALDAWSAVLEGERIADESIAEYNKLTDDDVKRSAELTEEALEKYEEARDLFSEAATGFPEADFSAYTDYVDGKIELLGISTKANEAFLAGEKAEANDHSDDYNAKDKELVSLAEQLPSTPGEVVANAYEELAGEATDEYFDARDRAMRADETLQGSGD